jgi:hypothetical protein
MTTKEKLDLMNWCQEAVAAFKFYEAALQIQQLQLLLEHH